MQEGASTVSSLWTWHAHPDVWALVTLLAAGYILAVGLWGPRAAGADREPATRKERTLFFLGLLALWAGADWPIHDLAEDYLFSVHMVQHMIFSFVAPPLLLMGTPRWLLRKLLAPAPVAAVVRTATRPLVALIDLSLRSEAAHLTVHVILVSTALMMWWPVVGRLAEFPKLTAPANMLYLFLQSVLPTVPASFLTFASTPIYSGYAQVAHPWIGAVADQRIAGLLMKLGGGALLWGVIAVLFFRWHAQEEAQEAEEVSWDDFERELEAWNLRK
jgi:putative membrane protein